MSDMIEVWLDQQFAALPRPEPIPGDPTPDELAAIRAEGIERHLAERRAEERKHYERTPGIREVRFRNPRER